MTRDEFIEWHKAHHGVLPSSDAVSDWPKEAIGFPSLSDDESESFTKWSGRAPVKPKTPWPESNWIETSVSKPCFEALITFAKMLSVSRSVATDVLLRLGLEADKLDSPGSGLTRAAPPWTDCEYLKTRIARPRFEGLNTFAKRRSISRSEATDSLLRIGLAVVGIAVPAAASAPEPDIALSTPDSQDERSEVAHAETSGLNPGEMPSQDTSEPWVWAYARHPETLGGGGKWLVYVSRGIVDRVWGEYAAATENGRLGFASKCSTAMKNETRGRPNTHVIVVYTEDREEELLRVLRVLRTELRVKQVLSYKTDAATLADEYGSGIAKYVSQRGSLDMERRRA